jgi:DNA polymerase-3 subunit beta
MALLRQISLFTSDGSSSVRFSFETGQLHLSAMSSEIGEAKVSMPVDFAGQRFDIAFNPYYLLDILRHTKDETVRIGLNDSHNPGLITDSSSALFVIMPMRLNEAPTQNVAEATV